MDNQEFIPGALPEIRPQAAQLKDYSVYEVVASFVPANWTVKKAPTAPEQRELNATTWRKFKMIFQNGSGSCVAQTWRKLCGIIYFLNTGIWLDLSASDPYGRRINKPSPGMGATDLFQIVGKWLCLNKDAPSDNMTDAQMDAVKPTPEAIEEGKKYAVKNIVVLPLGDIEMMASIIQYTKKGLMGWTFWDFDEWTAVPKILRDVNALLAQGRHSNAYIDFTLCSQENLPGHPYAWGKKALVLDESWRPTDGFAGQRVITEDFLVKRMFYAAYPINFAYVPVPPDNKPHVNFQKNLKFIPLNATKNISNPTLNASQEADVKKLQDMLRYEGLFPTNIPSTGYYGGLTADAVYKWQVKHSVAPLSELNAIVPKGGSFGPKSRDKANAMYP